MSTRFRSALLISATVHMSAMGTCLIGGVTFIQKISEDNTPMVVDYFAAEERKPVVVQQKLPEPKPAEHARNDIHVLPAKKMAEIRRPEPIKKDVVGIRQVPEAKRETIVKKVATISSAAIKEIAKKQDPVKSTREFIGYFGTIREKIRVRLKANYKNCYNEGEVRLVFVLNSDGSLVAVDTEKDASVKDKALVKIAMISVRQAAPFPKFPKELSLSQMYFNLVVSFKKQ